MKIHRYFFWIEDNFIEIYKNGNLEKYEGEEKLYINNFETFWEKWKKNSKIILSCDAIDFTFLIDNKVNKDDLLKGLDGYKKESEINFSSEDLKKILDAKNFKTIVFEFNDQKKVLTKTKGRYIESGFEEDLPEITLFGENIDEDILNKYSISLMQNIVTKSKFKTTNFPNIKYFSKLFRIIYENNLNVDKMLELLNLLYGFKNRVIMTFVTELLTLNSDENEFDILDNRHNFNDDFIEYLINNINGKNIFEVADFINNINIVPKEHDEKINALKI